MARRKQAFLRATPNPVPYVVAPGMGATTISWSTGDGAPGVVSVQDAGGEEVLFAQSPVGEAPAEWIHPGVVYHFRLYSQTQKRDGPLREISVQMEYDPAVQAQPAPLAASKQSLPERPKAYIKATPNPIPDAPGPELGTTTIEWSTGDSSNGWIYLLTAGKQEVLFASGPWGTRPAPWIQRNLAYRFTLYGDEGRTRKLASVTVTRGSPRRELALDLAVVGGAVVAVATPVVVAALTLKRVARKVLSR